LTYQVHRIPGKPSVFIPPGPYCTCLVDMKEVKDFPFEYALLFSTDHGKEGGIWMYVCNGVPMASLLCKL
jgi:hypothetical protein